MPLLFTDIAATAQRSVKPMPTTIAGAYALSHHASHSPSPRGGFSQSPSLFLDRDRGGGTPFKERTRADTPGPNADVNPTFAGLVKDSILKDQSVLKKESTGVWVGLPSLKGFCRRGVACKQGCDWRDCGFCARFDSTLGSVDMVALTDDLCKYFGCTPAELTLPGGRKRSASFDGSAKRDDGARSAAKQQDGRRSPSVKSDGRRSQSPGQK